MSKVRISVFVDSSFRSALRVVRLAAGSSLSESEAIRRCLEFGLPHLVMQIDDNLQRKCARSRALAKSDTIKNLRGRSAIDRLKILEVAIEFKYRGGSWPTDDDEEVLVLESVANHLDREFVDSVLCFDDVLELDRSEFVRFFAVFSRLHGVRKE